MVSIRLDYEEPGWQRTAVRCLRAGATLYGVPGERVGALTRLAEEHGLELTCTQTASGWRLTPLASGYSSSDPDPLSPPSEEERSTRADDVRPGSAATSPTDVTDTA